MRRALAASLLVLRLAAAAAPQPDPGAALRAADADYRAGRVREAGERLDALLAAHPGEPEALRLLGHVRFALGDEAGARLALVEALRHAPDAADVLGRLVEIDRKAGRFDAVAAFAARLAALEPEAAGWAVVRADALRRLGRTAEALAVARDVAERAPGAVPAWDALASAAIAAERIPEALRASVAAWHLGPPDARRAAAIAALWRRLDDDGREARWLGRAAASPGSPDELARARERRVALLLRAGRIDEARAVAGDPAPADLRVAIDLAALEAGAGGVETGPLFAALAGDGARAADDPARVRLARLLLAAGRAAEARRVVEAVRSPSPVSALLAAEAAAALGDRAAAVAALARYAAVRGIDEAARKVLSGTAFIEN